MIGRWLNDAKVLTVDIASFTAINAMQLRARGGRIDRAALEQYLARWQGADLQRYLLPPEGVRLELSDGRFEAPSPVPSGCPANDRVRLDVRLGPAGWQSPAMFLLHGLMSVSDRGYRRWSERLNERGWSAIFVHLPYHYERCPAGVSKGELAVTANLIRSAEGVRQAVIEVRLAMACLRERGCPRLGVWGMSYGGLVGALLAVTEPLHTAWLLEPTVDLDHALWESPATLVIRAQMRRWGLTRELTSQHLPRLCPSHHQPLCPPERILLLCGIFDRIMPPRVIRALAEQWRGSHYGEYRQGHVGYTLMPASLALGEQLGLL